MLLDNIKSTYTELTAPHREWLFADEIVDILLPKNQATINIWKLKDLEVRTRPIDHTSTQVISALINDYYLPLFQAVRITYKQDTEKFDVARPLLDRYTSVQSLLQEEYNTPWMDLLKTADAVHASYADMPVTADIY